MDEGLSAAVRKVFMDWYRAGLIYRGNRLVNWDPLLGTAVSDLEVNNVERDGHLWSIRYPVTGSDKSLVVATTAGDHPGQHGRGRTCGTALRASARQDADAAARPDEQIPVIADDYVDRPDRHRLREDRPAHDYNDYAIGQQHQLAAITIFTLDAKVNDNAPEKYRGLDRYDARAGRPRRTRPAGRDEGAPLAGAGEPALGAGDRADAHRPVVRRPRLGQGPQGNHRAGARRRAFGRDHGFVAEGLRRSPASRSRWTTSRNWSISRQL
ncbi:hypothetical protein RLIN73S_06904 [Rhodanobacter lindaniclasticus]